MDEPAKRPASAWVNVTIAALVLITWAIARRGTPGPSSGDARSPTAAGFASPPTNDPGAAAVEAAFRARASDVPVEVAGVVKQLLPDEREGTRFQRFLLQLSSGRAVLVEHDLELSERVPLVLGELVDLRGEYQWNNRGGVIGRTHHDPEGLRAGGWIRHASKLYE